MFTKYENGAEVEIEEVNRFESGAEVEADGVYAVKNGAEEQVWTAVIEMKELENTTKVASMGPAVGGDGREYWAIFATANEGGYVTYYIEGDFLNPTISFDWDGCYWGTRSDGVQQYAPAGSIEIYLGGNTTQYISAVSGLGNIYGSDYGSYSYQAVGPYTRIGFRVNLNNWGLSDPILYWIDISNIFINGEECFPGEDCEKYV